MARWLLASTVSVLLMVVGAARGAEPPRQETPEPETPAAAESEAIDAAKQAAFKKAVADTRSAMAERNLVLAKRHLRSVAANVQSAADRAQHDRLQMLLEHLEVFWKGVQGAVAKLQPAEELTLKDTRVAVVEASAQGLTVHLGGRNQSYRIEALPLPLLQAIVNQSFDPTPGSKVVVGAFLAADRQGDRKEARRFWEEAAKKGEKLGLEMMPELDAPLASGGKEKNSDAGNKKGTGRTGPRRP